MIEPHMQAMADALFPVAWMFENMAICCMANGHHVSAKVLYGIMDSLDNVWMKCNEEYQRFEQQLLQIVWRGNK